MLAAHAADGVRALRDEARRIAERRAAQHASALLTDDDPAAARRAARSLHAELAASRSATFAAPPRNERLALVTHLERGPYTHTPPPNDPTFASFEPHARTRLAERRIAHADIQQLLDCRYALVPNVLYALVRDAPHAMDGTCEVPVYGDWVLFGVMGEKSALRYTRAADGAAPRKYFSAKIYDVGAGGRSGDHVVHMLVFDGADGAFDTLWKEHDGTLLALLNPRFLATRDKTLTLTPRGATAIAAIGRAADYAQCGALRKDGSRCTAYVSRRGVGVCEFHLERAVEKRQRGRTELAGGTTSVASRIHGSGRRFSVPSVPRPPSDPRSAAFDIDARYGRARAEKENRKRRREELDAEAGALEVPPAGPAAPAAESAPAAAPIHLHSDARTLSTLCPHSASAHALRTAQDTLDRKRNRLPPPAPAPRRGAAAARLLARAAARQSNDDDDDLIIT